MSPKGRIGWVVGRLGDDEGSDNEDSDNEGSVRREWSPSPPWIQLAASEWASFAHRLLLRQELRDKHDVLTHHVSSTTRYEIRRTQDHFKHYRLRTYGRLLQALANGRHPLSTLDRVEFYLNGHPY